MPTHPTWTKAAAAASLAVAVAVCGAAGASEWPGFLGPHRNGQTTAGGLLAAGRQVKLEVLWQQPLGSGYSGIAAAAGRLYTMASDGTSDVLVALEAATGRELWRLPVGSTFKGHGGASDGPLSTPAVAGGTVYALGPYGRLVAVEAATGKPRWQRELVAELEATMPAWGVTSSPLVEGDLVLVQVGGPGARATCAFDAATGRDRWCSGSDQVAYQSPAVLAVGGRRQVLGVSNRLLVGHDPASGRELWSFVYAPRGGPGSAHPVAVGGDRLLIEADPEGYALYSLAPGAGGAVEVQRVWENQRFRHGYAYPLHHGEHLYGFGGSIFTCLRASDGELVWRARGPGEGEAILVDDHLIAWSNNGMLRVIPADPAGYREAASVQALSRGSFTTPSFADGVVYVRNLTEVAAVRVVPAA